jgi:hypothetical protein
MKKVPYRCWSTLCGTLEFSISYEKCHMDYQEGAGQKFKIKESEFYGKNMQIFVSTY